LLISYIQIILSFFILNSVQRLKLLKLVLYKRCL